VGDDRGLTAIDLLESGEPDQETMLIERETNEEIEDITKRALRKLDGRERFIISKRFMEENPWTLQKIGEHFGTSRERVRQLEKRALTKLKRDFSGHFAEGAVSCA
jgi:RNA polymerase sigma-32 factor